MKIAQYKWVLIDDVAVSVGTNGKMPEEPWKTFVNELNTKPIKKFLCVIIGSIEVTSVQRKLCIDVVNKRRIKAAVVNDSSVVRGIITAASWFSVDVKSFSPDQLLEAVRDLGVPTNREDAIVQAAEKLKTSVAS